MVPIGGVTPERKYLRLDIVLTRKRHRNSSEKMKRLQKVDLEKSDERKGKCHTIVGAILNENNTHHPAKKKLPFGGRSKTA